MRKRDSLIYLALFIFMNVLLFGCVATPEVKQKDNRTVFFPEPPELPRYQFLRSFIGSSDFQAKSSGLDLFLGAGATAGYTLKKPSGIVMQQGKIYVADTQATVFTFDLVNQKFGQLKGAKGLGRLVQPVNVSLGESGNKYVCDPVRGQVIMFDKNDFYIKAFSNPKPWKPVDAEEYEGHLYVVDSTRGVGGIKVFDIKSGEILDIIGNSGPRESRMLIGTNLAIDDQGFLYVMDAGRFQIVKYDRDGHYRGHLGDPGDTPGHFGRPRGIAIDRSGRIYAVDAAYDIVQVFAANGQVLSFFGGSEAKPGSMTLPSGVYIDYDPEHIKLFKDYIADDFEVEYLVFVTSQFSSTNSLNVYGFGKKRGVRYPSDRELYDELKEERERLIQDASKSSS